MGVTADFIAINQSLYDHIPTFDTLEREGIYDPERGALTAAGEASGACVVVHSPLGANKRWYWNIDADHAWTRARERVAEPLRAAYDHWFSHLFWDDEGAVPCACQPRVVAPDERFYDAAWLEHVCALRLELEPAMEAIAETFADGSAVVAASSWIFEPEGFAEHVMTWQRVLEHARRQGADFGLLMGIWY